MSTTIGLFLFDGAEELDWAGPWEVLSAWAQNHPEDDIEVFTFAQSQETVSCAKGLRVIPDHTWATMPELDVLVYPGGRGTRAHLGNPEISDWLRGVAKRAEIVASVCTGSLVLADVGLLDGLAATTHWGSLDMLTSRFVPTIDLSTTGRSSPRPASRRASTWRFI
jgi:transcriptional regulator GlxA family with amidase domain